MDRRLAELNPAHPLALVKEMFEYPIRDL